MDLRQNMEMKMFFLYLSNIIGAEINSEAIKTMWKSSSEECFLPSFPVWCVSLLFFIHL